MDKEEYQGPEVDIRILIDPEKDISDIQLRGKVNTCLASLSTLMIDVALKSGFSKEDIVKIIESSVNKYQD